MAALNVKPGLSANAIRSIPKEWSAEWFRRFVTNYLENADIRNAKTSGSATISGVISEPATVGTAGGSGGIPLSSLQNINPFTTVGNPSAIAGSPIAMTRLQLTALVNTFSATLSGAAPASGGGTANFLRADGTWRPPSAGSGTVTSVAVVSAGSNSVSLSVSGSPITTNGTVSLTMNLFTSTAPGIVPLSGGGTANFLRADGTWAAPSGGGGSANITPDTHPSSPTAWDDEFEFGTSLDTSGSRFAGANAWSWANQNSGTGPVSAGSLVLTYPTPGNATNVGIVYQTAPAGTWTITSKVAFSTNNVVGMFAGSTTGKFYVFGLLTTNLSVLSFNSPTSFNATQVSAGIPTVALNGTTTISLYLQINWDGTNVNFLASTTGVPGSFLLVYSVAGSAFLGGAPASIGFALDQVTANSALLVSDWFRRTA